jgi:hypothetical protein
MKNEMLNEIWRERRKTMWKLSIYLLVAISLNTRRFALRKKNSILADVVKHRFFMIISSSSSAFYVKINKRIEIYWIYLCTHTPQLPAVHNDPIATRSLSLSPPELQKGIWKLRFSDCIDGNKEIVNFLIIIIFTLRILIFETLFFRFHLKTCRSGFFSASVIIEMHLCAQ